MTISLSTLKRRERPKPPIVVLYGPAGCGKTTLAAGAKDPVFLAVEDGLGTLDVPYWPINSYKDALQAIGTLYSEEHDRRTMVVDSVDWLEAHVQAETCRRNNWQTIEEPSYGKGYVAALLVWREFIEGVRALRDERGMMVILIAHHQVKRFEDPNSEPYDRYQLRMHDKASALVTEAADVVCFLNYRVSIRKEDVGFNKKIARGVGGGQRVLHLEERPGFIAKNRFGAPSSVDLPTSQEPDVLWRVLGEHLPEPWNANETNAASAA